tara:strand:- start:657 stop:770 length:114 start_codon:yes stop_codon:yes gene_type:complete
MGVGQTKVDNFDQQSLLRILEEEILRLKIAVCHLHLM